MGYTRDIFGIEYDASRRDRGDGHLLRWTVGGVAVLALLSFLSARGCARRVKIPDFKPPAAPAAPAAVPRNDPPPRATTVTPPGRDVKVTERRRTDHAPATVPAAARMVERWLADSGGRPAQERTLLEKLLAAERSSSAMLALDTLERLRKSPAMADLDEPLARRIGALNMQRLMSGKPTPWTATVVSRRGDTPYRIAREHATTVAAVLKLNGLVSDAKLAPGTTLRVLEFTRAALVVHRRTKQADLMLNGKFFKRYYASTGATPKPGSILVTREAGPRTRFKEFSITFAPADLDEIAMLLPPNSSIVVTDP